MILDELIGIHRTLENLIQALEPVETDKKISARLQFANQLIQTDSIGTTLFHQLINSPTMTPVLFNRMINLLDGDAVVSEQVSLNLNKGLSSKNISEQTWADALLTNLHLMDITGSATKTAASVVPLLLVKTLASKLLNLDSFDHLLRTHSPNLSFHPIKFLSSIIPALSTTIFPEELRAPLSKLLSSIHTPRQETAIELYRVISQQPVLLLIILHLITIEQESKVHLDQLNAHKTALGLAQLLKLSIDIDDEEHTLFSVINKEKQFHSCISQLLTLTKINFDAYKTTYSAITSERNKKQFSMPDISQNNLINIFTTYQHLAGGKVIESFQQEMKGGMCHGAAYCYGLFNLYGKRNWWNDLLYKIASWNRMPFQLTTEYTLIDSDRPESLATLIERAFNYISSAQKLDFLSVLPLEITVDNQVKKLQLPLQ